MIPESAAQRKRSIVTGRGCFIGSNFVEQSIAEGDDIVTIDLFTHVGNRTNQAEFEPNLCHAFVHADICDAAAVTELFWEFRTHAIVHFAAESHVDRSIVDPGAFIRTNVTNVQGTLTLLQQAKAYWSELSQVERGAFRFLHVSTDKVYGSLKLKDPAFSETPRTLRTVLMQPPRPALITWFAPIFTSTACRP